MIRHLLPTIVVIAFTGVITTAQTSASKTDVWDFGAAALDSAIYNNLLSVSAINSWYDPAITPGTQGNVLPQNFTAGALSWTGGSNDRLRTTNTAITRYDENISSAPGYTGRIYVNSAGNTSRFLSLTLEEDDEVTVVTKTDAGGILNFEHIADPKLQQEQIPLSSSLTALTFVAKTSGSYRLFDTQGKPSYYRIFRRGARYINLSGHIDLSGAPGIPAGYQIICTNEVGKVWTAQLENNTYSLRLPAGYPYTFSLRNANGYIIAGGENLLLSDTTTQHDLVLAKVTLFNMSGNIQGLGSLLPKLELAFEADPQAGSIYVPKPVVNPETATYTVALEAALRYTISATGVNDYFLPQNTISLTAADSTHDIAFQLKPLYAVDLQTTGLPQEALSAIELTFSHLDESGYQYTFLPGMEIMLRNGTYKVSATGLDLFPFEAGLSSNLIVNGQPTSKILNFKPVNSWFFGDKVISNGDTAYKGLLFSGAVYNEITKGHLAVKPGASIRIPANPGEKVRVSYYYSADFTLDGGTPVGTNTQSTNTIESMEYVYPGTEAGYLVLAVGSGVATTYLTGISRSPNLPYIATLKVGPDKDYHSINAALDAVRNMNRPENERVTLLIDPGNYEEMLVMDRPNITLKNAAREPDIELRNRGVDTGPGAVRVTSYYGHGYHYYSMNNQKWDADVLRVNKENGSYSYDNKGAGTTNQSYWNATVVVLANGFEAENIIFENSFNQYISQKETEDIVVTWPSGSKGDRPTDYGNTAVQDRTFVERAAALAIAGQADKIILNKCRIVGRQDSFFGGAGSRIVVYKGAVMGAVDFIFGAMTAVFYQTDLVMNTSDASSDAAYLTAAQQTSGRGYLMYECRITSTLPGIETASEYRAKPGYFGRPWLANTSEVVFFKTTLETSNYPGYADKSLIQPQGWQNTLGGTSPGMIEFGTLETSGEDNNSARASWATLLSQPILPDGSPIVPFSFTKGNDQWDPLPTLLEGDIVSNQRYVPQNNIQIYAHQSRIYLSRISSKTQVQLYDLYGRLYRTFTISGDHDFQVPAGIWFVKVDDNTGTQAVKVITF